MNNDKNGVINISNYNKCLSNEEEKWIRDECVVSCNILCINIDQETNYISTYEDEWPESITNLSNIKYKTEVGKLTFPINLLQANYSFETFQKKDIQLLKMDENVNDVAIYKYYDMVQNTRLITNAKFELVSPGQIIVNHVKYIRLNVYQFKTFDVWKNNYISKELISEYNEVSVHKKNLSMI